MDRIEKGGNYCWAAFDGTPGGNPASPFYGVYDFADYQYDGPVFGFRVDGASGSHVKIRNLGKAIRAMARDGRNNLYVLGHNDGIIYRLTHADHRATPTTVTTRAVVEEPRERDSQSTWARDGSPLPVYSRGSSGRPVRVAGSARDARGRALPHPVTP